MCDESWLENTRAYTCNEQQTLSKQKNMQAIQIKVDPYYHVIVRFYEKQDRRIVSRWEFVPTYDSTNIAESFTAMRTIRESGL